MTTFLGIACLVLGIMWIAFPVLANLLNKISSSNIGSHAKPEDRIVLFDAYLLLHDHLEKVGTPEQKAALEVVLSAIVVLPPEGK